MNLNKHPKCELGHPYVVRTNSYTKEKFWGCVFYPEHKSTIDTPYCSNNHPMDKFNSNSGEYFRCKNTSCTSQNYDFEQKDRRYHAQLINLFFKSITEYEDFRVDLPSEWELQKARTEKQEKEEKDKNLKETGHAETNYQRYHREKEESEIRYQKIIKAALENKREKERSENFKEYGVKETNEERIKRVLPLYEKEYQKILKTSSPELKELFLNHWNNPSMQARFIKIEPHQLLDYLNIMKPKTDGLNSFMPWNRGY